MNNRFKENRFYHSKGICSCVLTFSSYVNVCLLYSVFFFKTHIAFAIAAQLRVN